MESIFILNFIFSTSFFLIWSDLAEVCLHYDFSSKKKFLLSMVFIVFSLSILPFIIFFLGFIVAFLLILISFALVFLCFPVRVFKAVSFLVSFNSANFYMHCFVVDLSAYHNFLHNVHDLNNQRLFYSTFVCF